MIQLQKEKKKKEAANESWSELSVLFKNKHQGQGQPRLHSYPATSELSVLLINLLIFTAQFSVPVFQTLFFTQLRVEGVEIYVLQERIKGTGHIKLEVSGKRESML